MKRDRMLNPTLIHSLQAKLALSLSLACCVLSAAVAAAQTPAITHNTWKLGKPMPIKLLGAPAAVLGNEIYVVGGWNGVPHNGKGTISQTQIYNPASNMWRYGKPLPTPTCDASAAVVKDVLYVIGGQHSCQSDDVTGDVCSYDPKTKKWDCKHTRMPTPRWEAGITVRNNIIYVIGGLSPSGGNLSVVESYNPATDTWDTPIQPMSLPNQAQAPSVGLIGKTIVVADGWQNSGPTGDAESYNASQNMWTPLTSDPAPRGFACAGAIGPKLYDAGGADSHNSPLTLTESFTLSKQTWTTLQPMRHPVIAPGAAVYKGRLYCFGGSDANFDSSATNYVQIFQP